MDFKSYYKLPVPQTSNENCVAHNGTLIPVPGRDIMAQGWYQGGISVFDWTDPSHPQEIAFFDRGPMDSTKLVGAGSWSAYWYNGYIISSEIARGLDILELKPSPLLSQNEIDAAKLIRFDYLNAQDQQQLRKDKDAERMEDHRRRRCQRQEDEDDIVQRPACLRESIFEQLAAGGQHLERVSDFLA